MFRKNTLIRKIMIGSFVLGQITANTAGALTTTGETTAGFTDIQTHWAKDAIQKVSATCNIEGYKDAHGNLLHVFKPDESITRAELAQLIVKCKYPTSIPSAKTGEFSDVFTSDWFYNTVNHAKEMSWVDGYEDGTFRPNTPVNRAEAVKMVLLTKYNESELTGGTANFKDVIQQAWYYPFVSFALEQKIISGYSNSNGTSTGYFGPDRNITRAEAIKVIALVNGYMKAEDFKPIEHAVSTTTPHVGNCQIFPSDNPWNTDISHAPLHPDSEAFIEYITSILGGNQHLHADFGGNGEYGIPYTVVGAGQPMVEINITDYPEESDAGPFPIPTSAKIENGSDAHVLTVDKDNCKLYELYGASVNGAGWNSASSAKFDLTSNALRPEGWTSADAAGLPIFPGLARLDEVKAGTINHALRVTFSDTQMGYISPARHHASDNTDPFAPPMGLRLRLRADYDISGFTGQSRVILEALKKYGLIVADNGSNWFISGASEIGWDDEDLNQLKTVPGSAFEVVDTGVITNG